MIRPPFKLAPRLPKDFDPEGYGLHVEEDRDATDAELGEFYARVKESTGVTIPALERFLGARALEGEDRESNEAP